MSEHILDESAARQLWPHIQRTLSHGVWNKIFNGLKKPRKPRHCHFTCVRHSTGGVKLTRKRLIKKWMKIRPGHVFPHGKENKKVVKMYDAINWMYYPQIPKLSPCIWEDDGHGNSVLTWEERLRRVVENIDKREMAKMEKW